MQASLITAGTVRGTLGSMYPRHHIDKTTTNPLLRTAGLPSGRSAKPDYDAYWGRGGLEPPDLLPSIVIGSEALARRAPQPRALKGTRDQVGAGRSAEVLPRPSIGYDLAVNIRPLLTAKARDTLWLTSKHRGCW